MIVHAPMTELVDWATIDWITTQSESAGPLPGGAPPRRAGENIVATARSVLSQYERFLAALLAGLLLGVLGVVCDACSNWVSSFRLGLCAKFFWLAKDFCCVSGGECGEFYAWGEFLLGHGNDVVGFTNFCFFVAISTAAAMCASYLCKVYAPYASGGGINEVKTIVSGHHVRRYFGGWTLATKIVAMSYSTGSGLVVGREGPFVHIGACVGDLVAGLFPGLRQEGKRRELVTAGAAGGVAVAFGAPVGGVIFALEEVSSFYNFKTMLAALICGVTAVLVQSNVDLRHTGRIVQFSVNYQHNWHFFELPMFAAIGYVGGFVGSLFTVVNIAVIRWRKRHVRLWRVTEAAVVSAVTACVNFVVPFGKDGLGELLGSAFQDCTPLNRAEMCHHSDLVTFFCLLLTATVKLLLFFYTVGIFLPSGILVPSLAIGALYGRAFGMFFRALQETYATSYLFAECSGQTLCVIPGMYAIVGAAAVLTGVTRMTICLAVIMFELTGSLHYLVPVIIGILSAKAAGEAVGVAGNYEVGIEENNLPFLDPKREFKYDAFASDMYAGKRFTVLAVYDMTIRQLSDLLARMEVSGFPVVKSMDDKTLVGYVRTRRLVKAIQAAAVQHRDIGLDTRVRFDDAPSPAALQGTHELDLSHIVASSTVQVEPECPIGRILYLFKSLGSHHVMVTRHSRFEGFISKKDLLAFMRRVEREAHMEDAELEREDDERCTERM